MIAQKKGFTSWTEQEEKFLRENYRHHPARVLAEVLGRSRNSVIGRASRIGLSRPYSEVFRAAKEARFKEKSMPKIVPDEPTSADDYLSRNLLAISRKRGETNQRRKPTYAQDADLADKVEPLNGVGVSLWDAQPNQCRWVVGDPKAMTFCGHEKRAGSSYCQSHFEASKSSVKQVAK